MSDNGSPIEFYHKNPRQITVQQFENLERWLEELGDLSGVVHDLNSNMIIGGNQRGRVFEINECEIVLEEVLDQPDEQGTVARGYVLWKEFKYIYRQVRWTEHQCEMANIVANKAGGEWDFDILANEFELDDLLNWGFIEHDLDLDLWLPEPPEDPGAQIDRAEELREKWGVETGQLWQLGEHRLICGDCTDAGVMAKAMDGEKANMVFTDPPYGIGLDSSYSGMPSRWQNKELEHKFEESIIGDDKPFDASWLIPLAKEVFLFGADYYANTLPDSGINGTWFVWDKREDEEGGEVFDKMLGSPFELIWCKKKRGKKFIRMRWASFFSNADGESSRNRFHPTQKPAALGEWFMSNYGEDDDIVLDPYLGSGSFLIACERLGRKCRAVEISPAYCAVAIQRWVDMTGGEPELLSDPHGIEEPSQY